MSNKHLSGVKGLGLGLGQRDARRSYTTDSTRVQGQGLGTALVRGRGEGVYPKKSLQWTCDQRGDDVLVTIE